MLVRVHLRGQLSVTSPLCIHRLDWKPEYWCLIGMDFQNSSKRNYLDN